MVRKSLSKKLKSQGYLKESFQFLPLPVCLVNWQNIILETNQAFQDLTQYEKEEIVGLDLKFFFLEKKEIEALKRKVPKAKESIIKELTLLAKDGRKIPVRISTFPQKIKSGYFLSFLDLSEIKRSQIEFEKRVKEKTKELEKRAKELELSRKALINILEDVEEERGKAEEERDKTKTIITNFADGLLVFDQEWRLSLINSQAELFLSVKAKDLIGKKFPQLLDFPLLKPIIGFLKKESREIFRQELQIGENLILEISTISLLKEKKKIGTLVILHDITREKMVEKMKTEFVSLSAHQLRTPLSAIKWTLKMILEGDIGKITQEQKEFLEKTYTSNERMIRLINELLDVTRIEEGRYLYKPTLIDFAPMVQFVINSFREIMEKKKIKVEFKKPKEKLPRVSVDVEKMGLAIQNLLDNAIRYNRIGGKVTIALKSGKKEIEFSIKDSGVGIPKAQQGRVFSRFFRGSNVIRLETEGTGLGLFMTKNIIVAHGGRIWFESEEDKGSTFYFTLPTAE